MLPFQKMTLTGLRIEGLVDFNKKLEQCSAQEIIAALMLHHPTPEVMQRVLTDLSIYRDSWNSFFMGAALPSTNKGADPGSLVCLRDLWTGWGGNTLYLLTSFSREARVLQTLARNWGCTEVKVLPPKLTGFLVGMRTVRHHLLVARWERTLFLTEEMDFATTYGATPQGFEQSLRLSACSPQSLMARLLLKRGLEQRRASKIMDDLQLHADLW
jgi:hypothetical protein